MSEALLQANTTVAAQSAATAKEYPLRVCYSFESVKITSVSPIRVNSSMSELMCPTFSGLNSFGFICRKSQNCSWASVGDVAHVIAATLGLIGEGALKNGNTLKDS